MQYRVASTIVSGNIDNGEPVDVQWYNGDNLAIAIAASAQAAANYLDADERIPKQMRPRTLSVQIEFLDDEEPECGHNNERLRDDSLVECADCGHVWEA